MQRTTQPPRATQTSTANSQTTTTGIHARTASGRGVQSTKPLVKSVASVSGSATSAHSSPVKKPLNATGMKSAPAYLQAGQQRRALQPLDGNRLSAMAKASAPTTATTKSALIKPTPFSYVSRFSRPQGAVAIASAVRRPLASSAAQVTSVTSLPGLKRKQHHLEELVVQQQQLKPATTAPTPVAADNSATAVASPDTEESANAPERENVAWLDMLVALLERKYQAYQPPVCVEDLEDAKMLDAYWKKPVPAKTPSKAELVVKAEPSSTTKRVRLSIGGGAPVVLTGNTESEKEERRQQALRRHAQQIQDTSVASTACCGCKTGCLKMYCVCFSTRGYCNAGCNCDNCKNARGHAEQRLEAITTYLANDPRAFSYAASASDNSSGFFQLLPEKSSTVVLRGCRCKKSKCLKKYCECFQNGLGCSAHCRCVDCSNDSSAGARELRAKNKAAMAVPTKATSGAGAFHAIQVAVTKKPRRNFVQKTMRLSL